MVNNEILRKKVLMIATTSYAGIGPYVVSIVNSFQPEDDVLFFLVEREDEYYTRNVRSELLPLTTIVKDPIKTRLDTLSSLIFNPKFPYTKEILQLIKSQNIDVVHSLTSLGDYRLIRTLNNRCKLLYTVHDLVPHEQNKVWYKEWRMSTLYGRIYKSMTLVKYFVTNSSSQFNQLAIKYPEAKRYFFSFPTLVTETVSKGTKNVSELRDIEKYILFFGRSEAYKGLELLAEAFLKADLPEDIYLVIAGKGQYDGVLDKRILLINRYIDDTEIAYLYQNSLWVAYPYISATQSGVLSIAGFFGTPTIVSDIAFFKDELGDKYPFCFNSGDVNDLAKCLRLSNNEDSRKLSNGLMKSFYKEKYCNRSLREELIRIYNEM